MPDTSDITSHLQSIFTCGNKTNSPKSLTLQRPRQLEQADAKLRREIREIQPQYGWTKFLAAALLFGPLRKKSDKNSIGEFLAYISSPIEGSILYEPLVKQLRQILHWRVQSKGATYPYGHQDFIRLGRSFVEFLKLQERLTYPGCKSRFTHQLFQRFEANAAPATRFIEQWLDWMIMKPYDKEGTLTDPWKRRIRYFTAHQQKLELLAESSPFEVWSMFLNPTWWMQLRTNYYGMILRHIVNSPDMLSSARTQLRLKYDASGYGRARKSSRLRKSIRAEVESATPHTWNVQAV
ncbi:MAG: hypothetical protein Q9180_006462, partial [Flavoplaca navasiana]